MDSSHMILTDYYVTVSIIQCIPVPSHEFVPKVALKQRKAKFNPIKLGLHKHKKTLLILVTDLRLSKICVTYIAQQRNKDVKIYNAAK